MGVIMIAREKAHYSVRITVQNVDERHGNGGPGAAIQWLRDQAGIVHVPQFFTVVSFVCARHDENLAITEKEWFEPSSCLGQKTFSSNDSTKLLRPGVACNP